MSHITTGQISELLDLDRRCSGLREDFQEFLRHRSMILREFGGYLASARLDRVDSGLNLLDFPFGGEVAMSSNMKIVTPKELGGPDMTDGALDQFLFGHGLRRANLAELFTYADKKWIGMDQILGPSSKKRPDCYDIPVLSGSSGDRALELFTRGHAWKAINTSRYLVVEIVL